MLILKKMIQMLLISGSLLFYGCSSSDDPPADTTLSGTFTTPVVKGLKYSTSSQSGTTDASGTFKYKDGEIISFYIGDIFVGQTYAKNIITPLDLEQVATPKTAANTKSSNINDNWAVNLFNLLLALDSDGDANNGIVITAEIATQAGSVTLNLDLPPADFIADSATVSFTTTVSVTLSQPADVSIFIATNYSNNSNWGSMVWGTSSWSSQ